MAEAGRERVLVVALDGEYPRVALPAGRVRGLAPVPALTRMPGAPACLVGLAERRGTALPVLDLARLLAPASGRELPGPALRGRMVVAEAEGPVGLLVAGIVGLAADPGGAAILDLPGLIAGRLARRSGGAADAAAPHRHAASPRAAPDTAPDAAFLTLTVAGRSYALPLDAVEAVTRRPESVAPASEAGSAAPGTMPWRGRPLPLLDLAARLGLAGGVGTRVAVLRGVGLVAERVGPVLRVRPEAIDPVPRTLRRAGPAADWAAGFLRRDDGTLVCLLSPQALAGAAEPARAAPVAPGTEPIVVVDLAGSAYGLPAGAVRRVERAPDALVRVPRAPGDLAGMLAIRGGALPVLDLRRRLGLPPGIGPRRLVVIEAGGARAGLLVDGAARLVRPEAGAIRPAPRGIAGDLAEGLGAALTRVADLPGGPLPLIDPAALLRRAAFAGRSGA
ncbi:purine-binding chemotaxis protein CheW [Methylobacterium sp. 174MFSha1.1]|uniref:chemotaxis protein CheW n=1 Tax=Methylobacterium sp. 174MFSha1.1 TaxID=1502749 RepID=UPI0008F01D3C|nr:chemotaxis protein CheW [Methylobacterium sp. 174MFSha1.1]SFU33761.1 purine-binding chemotaxis protein CheW [Methylobacterium sp. 174MFSha1.1]